MSEENVQVQETQQEEKVLVYNIHDPFIPTEFAYIDYQHSWKKCRCGRVAHMNDNFCGTCGQKLGRPNFND